MKYLLEKGKSIDKNFKNEQNLNSIINDVINIEKGIEKINNIEKKIKQCKKSQNKEIIFIPNEEKYLDELKNKFKSFGNFILSDKPNQNEYIPKENEKMVLNIINNFRKDPKGFIKNKNFRIQKIYENFSHNLEIMNELQIDKELINIANEEVIIFADDPDYQKYQIGEELNFELSERFVKEDSALIALEGVNKENLITKIISNYEDKEKKGRDIFTNNKYTHIGFSILEDDDYGNFIVIIFSTIDSD